MLTITARALIYYLNFFKLELLRIKYAIIYSFYDPRK